MFKLSFFIQILFYFQFLFKNISSNKQYVTDVSYETFSSFLSSNLVLIEFYAPWCGSCQSFERTYNVIGKTLSNEGFSVGRVNIDENQALAARFGIKYLPTLYLIRDYQVYRYDGANTVESVVNFALENYKNTEPIPYLPSPLGPIGSIKGFLTRLGITLINIQPFLMKELGVSQFVSYILTAFFFGGVILTLVTIGVYLQVMISHQKKD